MKVVIYPPETELTIDTDQITFNGIVSNIVNRKLREYAHTEVDEINNTYLHPDLRTHFISDNIYRLTSNIFYKFDCFTVSRTKYKLEEFDGISIGLEALYQNRLDFINSIRNCDNILNFVFFNFRFN